MVKLETQPPVALESRAARLGRWLNLLGPLLGLAAIFGLFAVLAPHGFASASNLETIARQTAIVGAAVGALHGKKKLPKRWIDKLSGRTTDSDDGRIFDTGSV